MELNKSILDAGMSPMADIVRNTKFISIHGGRRGQPSQPSEPHESKNERGSNSPMLEPPRIVIWLHRSLPLMPYPP